MTQCQHRVGLSSGLGETRRVYPPYLAGTKSTLNDDPAATVMCNAEGAMRAGGLRALQFRPVPNVFFLLRKDVGAS